MGFEYFLLVIAIHIISEGIRIGYPLFDVGALSILMG